jgi:hypothetical protein
METNTNAAEKPDPYVHLVAAILRQALTDVTSRTCGWRTRDREASLRLLDDTDGDLTLLCGWLNTDVELVQRALRQAVPPTPAARPETATETEER